MDEFQKVVTNYQICVVSKDHFHQIIYKGPTRSKCIYLLYEDNHFDLIKSMARLYNKCYYCHLCKVGYDHKYDHRCEKTCKICFNGNCQVEEARGSIANYVIDILRIDSAIAVATVTNTSIERPTILVKVTTALNCIAESVRTIFL